jgi:CRP/FNR family transcriptional regulator, anaerobic regulatory protein
MHSLLINYLRLFRHVSAEDEALISAAFVHRSLKEGDVLFSAGHVCKEMFFICNGVLRIMVQNEKGVEVTYFFLKENYFCTILNSFNNEVAAHESIQAACDAEVMLISKTRLTELYLQIPYLKNLVDGITQQGLLDKIRIRNAYLGLDSTERYKLFMMRQPEIALRVPLADVASYLGITPQSLSRIRKNMR